MSQKENMEVNQNKRIAFWGTPALVLPFLDALENSGNTPILIITGEDKPVGRGLNTVSPVPKVWARNKNIEVLQPRKLDEYFQENFRNLNIDLSIVVAYGKMIPEKIINLPTFGTINVHYSLLPKYRGATPVEAALLHGDTVTGVSIQQMARELDRGDLLVSKEVLIPQSIRKRELFEILNKEAVNLLIPLLENIFNKKAQLTPQDNNQATTCGKIKKEDGEITLGKNHELNWNKWRAYEGWPGIFTFGIKNGKSIRVTIKNVEYKNGIFTPTRVVPEGGKEINFKDASSNISFPN